MTAPRWLAAAFAGLLAAAPAAAQDSGKPTSPDEAAKFLAALGNEAIKVLGSPNGTLDEREAHLRRLLSDNFDLQRIGRFVLGQAWNGASQEQRAEYLQLFSEYVLATYSRRLGGYSGEKFKIVKAEQAGKQDVVVFTEITRPSGPPLICGWRVRDTGGGLKILDVMVDGLSMINTQRSEFAAVVQRQGVDGLLEMLRLQLSKFAARQT
jgi:phospholipid transport system substrate-binding protein